MGLALSIPKTHQTESDLKYLILVLFVADLISDLCLVDFEIQTGQMDSRIFRNVMVEIRLSLI